MGLLFNRKNDKPFVDFKLVNNSNLKNRSRFFSAIDPKSKKENDKKLSFKIDKDKSKVFFIEFKGNTTISNINEIREKINAVIDVANENDILVFSIESPGGAVCSYGHLTYELERVKKEGIQLITVVDQVAASGGYMLAVTGDRVVATPNSILGSIGVLVQFPNFEELLRKIGVEFSFFTAGKNKVPLNPFNKPTEEGKEHLNKELEKTHKMFKDHVSKYRKDTDIDKVSEGDTFSGTEALELKMIDEIGSSDELIRSFTKNGQLVMKVCYEKPEDKRFLSRMTASISENLFQHISETFINLQKR
tara:strand:+ start:29003 stop:29917 length:915 start_codon:yes stop_codon:yes gene_type:complete